jgi:hypothetical protein
MAKAYPSAIAIIGMNIPWACPSSLLAVHAACQSLLDDHGYVFTPTTWFVCADDSALAKRLEALARELRRLNMMPGRIVHLWSLVNRRRVRRRTILRTPRRLLGDARNLALDYYYSLLFLAGALACDADAPSPRPGAHATRQERFWVSSKTATSGFA